MYTWIILGVIALIALLSAGHAALFGLRKATTRLIVVVLSAVAAIGTCLLIKQYLPSPDALVSFIQSNMQLIEEHFGINVVAFIEQAIEYSAISPTLVELAIQLAASLILPLACLLLFAGYALGAWLVCMIVFACIRHAEKKREEEAREEGDDEEATTRRKGSRWLAASLGLVQGLVIVIMLFIPVTGYLAIAQPTVNELTAQKILNENDPAIQTAQEIIGEVNTSHVITTYRIMGGEFLCNTMMDMKVAGMQVNATEEVGALITLAQHVSELSKTEFANYGEEEAAIIRSIGESFGDSKLLSPILGDILYAATDAWLNGETFLGMAMPSLGEGAEMFEPFVIALLEILHDDAKEAVLLQADIKTVAEMVAILANNRVFANMSDPEALMSSLSGGDLIPSLITVLGTNDTMKRLIPEAMNLGVRSIGQILSIPADAQTVYDGFMDTVTTTLNDVRDMPEEQRIEMLSEKLNTSFDQAGLDVDEQVLDFYATAMLHDLVDSNQNQEVTSADVQAFFVLYAQSAVQTTESLSTRPRFDMLSSVEPATDPLAGSVYASMTEEQRLHSAAAAVANLCVKLSKLNEKDQDVAEQAGTLITETFTELLGEGHAALEVVSRVQITAPISQTSVSHASSLQSTETMKQSSSVITLEFLLVDTKDAALKITAESILSDANAISAIFNAATELKDVLGNTEGKMDIASLAGSVGTILDSLQKTGAFGQEKTADLFTAVLQSETVRDTANLDIKTATQLANKATEGEVNYSQTMGTIAGSVNIMETLSADGEISEEELVDLIKNINPQTAGMIEIYVTPARLMEHGVPEEHSGITSELIQSLFSYMAREDLKDYDKEAKALNQVLQIALAAKDSEDKNLFSSAPGAQDGKLPTAKETVEILLDSQAVCFAMVDVMTDGTKVTQHDPYGFAKDIAEGSQNYVDFVTAVDEHRAAHPEINDLTYAALGALLGIELDLNN